MHIDVDRTKAQQVGFSALDVAQNLLISLSGSFQTAPTFWLDPETGVSYNIVTQTPRISNRFSSKAREHPDLGTEARTSPKFLADMASFSRGSEMAVVSHYNVQPVIDIFGSVDGRDLGGVARDITPIINQSRKNLPRGSQIKILGQIQTMNSSFVGLLAGLGFSIVLVYLLIVVNFQSWLDPFIILMALPAALAGIVWFLFITRHHDQRPGADRSDHVHGRGHVKQHSFDQLFEGKTAGREDSRGSGARSRLYALPARFDDGAGDDHRHASDVTGAW